MERKPLIGPHRLGIVIKGVTNSASGAVGRSRPASWSLSTSTVREWDRQVGAFHGGIRSREDTTIEGTNVLFGSAAASLTYASDFSAWPPGGQREACAASNFTAQGKRMLFSR